MFGFGTVFALIRPAVLGGTWSEKILYSFAGGGDGEQPLGGLALSANGDLFGTTTGGGSSGCGTVFAMTPQAGGAWEKSILHSFRCDDGAYPESALLLWPGYVFGTASGGGPGNSGSVFILKAPAVSGNAWTSGFHSLNASTNGANPVGNLIWGRDGAVLGTAMNGGPSGQGTVFRVVP
jgi:uncharacterized repeat protein (TIGR03803 family)